MRYRRDFTGGATYFFTVVTFHRLPLLADLAAVEILRNAIRDEKLRRPFQIDAMVILPDHLHALWTLPPDDSNYSIRWRNIKRSFTNKSHTALGNLQDKGKPISWQNRFWEHRIRDERDFARHVDYIHYNPVKHGLVTRPVDWLYSSIHRYIRQGILTADWGASCDIEIPDGIGYE